MARRIIGSRGGRARAAAAPRSSSRGCRRRSGCIRSRCGPRAGSGRRVSRQELLEDVALALGGADAAIVGAHAAAVGASRAPGSTGGPSGRSRSTFSTRWVRGHQRGRWYGSETTRQIRRGRFEPPPRETRGISAGTPRPSACAGRARAACEIGCRCWPRGSRGSRSPRAGGRGCVERSAGPTTAPAGCLAVGGGAEDPQVAPGDPNRASSCAGLGDLAVGLVVHELAFDLLRLHDPPLLEVRDDLGG